MSKKKKIPINGSHDIALIAKQYSEAMKAVKPMPFSTHNKKIENIISKVSQQQEKIFHNTTYQRQAKIFKEVSDLCKASIPELPSDYFKTSEAYEALYKNPIHSELDQYISAAQKALNDYPSYMNDIHIIAEKIHSPWLNIYDSTQSLIGLAGFSVIGETLNNELHPFSSANSMALRNELGDWRSDTNQQLDDMNCIRRVDLYTSNGLNTGISSFPNDTFNELLDVTSIQNPIIAKANNSIVEPEGEANEHETESFSTLRSLELTIRRFIDEVMIREHGNNWLQRPEFKEFRETWLGKKEKQRDLEQQDYRLIHFADFTDYERIIIQKSNWNYIFKPIFKNKESLRESFRRLYPIRLATMHSRTICSDDILYLRSESTRLLKAINKP